MRSVFSLVLCLAAPFALMASLDVPLMRSTGAPAWLLLLAGTALGWSATAGDKRFRVRLVAVVNTLILLVFTWGFFVFARMPETPAAEALVSAPDFALPDSQNRRVTLSEELAKGPVLLVFYRGFW